MLRKSTLSILILLATLPAVAQKRKVTVMDFGYATVRNDVVKYFGSDQDIGKGISDQLIAALLDGGDYRVIERSELQKIIKEQNFSNSDRADPATAAKIGGLLGVDTMIIGDVTSFGNEDKHYGGGGGGANTSGGMLGRFGLNKSTTMVEITARMVDVNTGEILASVTGSGQIQKTSIAAGGGGCEWWHGCGGGALDMSSSNFQNSAIGKAVKQSVTQLATNLDAKAPTLPAVAAAPPPPPPPPPPPLDGEIADATTADIVINVGTKDGVKSGDTLSVVRVGKVIKDPVTGKPLRAIESPVGTLTITSADTDSSVGKFSGTGTPKIGDHVKRPPSS
jgi:curli biogenesis system outer membrane secretion channel CsgG